MLYIDTDISDTHSIHNSVTKLVKSSGTEGCFNCNPQRKKVFPNVSRLEKNTNLILTQDLKAGVGGGTKEIWRIIIRRPGRVRPPKCSQP